MSRACSGLTLSSPFLGCSQPRAWSWELPLGWRWAKL